jgi:hypothetical protein
MRCYSIAFSEIGLRSRNEDSFYGNCDSGVFILADGLGGQEDGHIASATAVDTTVSYIQDGFAANGNSLTSEGLENAVLSTHGRIAQLVEAYESERRVNRLVRHEIEDYEPKTLAPPSWADLEGDDLVRFITAKLAPSPSIEEQHAALDACQLVVGSVRDAYNRIHVLLKIEASRDLDENEVDYYFDVISRYMFPKAADVDIGYKAHRISRLTGARSFLIEFDIDDFSSYGAILFGLAASIDKKIFSGMRVDFFYRSFVGLDAQPIICSDDGLIAALTAQEFRYSR